MDLISRYFEKAQNGDTGDPEDMDEDKDTVPPAYLPLPDATRAALKVPTPSQWPPI